MLSNLEVTYTPECVAKRKGFGREGLQDVQILILLKVSDSGLKHPLEKD